MRRPDFENLLCVLRRQVPARPTLFEFILNKPFYERLTGKQLGQEGVDWTAEGLHPVIIEAYEKAGYDYVTCCGSDMRFPHDEAEKKQTISLNFGDVIRDRASYESYPWPDPDSFDYSRLLRAKDMLPAGMKLVVYGPRGVLEFVIELVGFDRLCMLLVDDPNLVADVFDAVGERLLRYYQLCASYETVGAMIVNDDWGFRTSTMFSPADMRRHVFPWHKRIVETIHEAGKPAILHSCGNLEQVMDDVIDDMGYDAKHSYEDAILPVESAYDRWSDRIAILGGIDLDFVCRSSPQMIENRCKQMLAKTQAKGGYALGTGNSVPEFVPYENYIAMIDCVR
jgi:uroporphyrinogen decarboxylase